MTKPVSGFLSQESDKENSNKKESKEQSETEKLKAFLTKTYRSIAQLKGDNVIDTNDVYELCELSGFFTSKVEINNLLIEIGFKKLDIQGAIEKIWLLEEITETQ